ncbi:hypothetical protein GGX14DRAFT_654992 [Mycena pura]|uniref:Alpha-amylase n=1 Tax=Mycena pura TaxID=153505 RepID=A0AAD6V3E4_9AGAR|nr:hypothetical protein GGX14DRAFT_654992 [Mycena pura]
MSERRMKDQNYTMASSAFFGFGVFLLGFYRDFASSGCKSSNAPTKAAGTREKLIAVLKKAEENGIVSYVDAVLNHRFGADRIETFAAVEVDTDDRTKKISDRYEY